MEAELYFQSEAALGEAPIWDAGTLYWVDIPGKALFAKPDAGASAQRYDIGLETGSFALWDQERIVLATERGFQCFHTGTKALRPWVNPEAGNPDNKFNDGKCDPRGRFVAGTVSRTGQAGKAALYSLSDERTVRKIYAPVTCSNGLAWSEDGTTMYYIDTRTGVVRSFRYALEQGALSDERVVIQIPSQSGKPDGMTIDREGNLWIALWQGGAVECWSPASGQRLARLAVPVALVTSCIFGGPRYDILFITTARGSATKDRPPTPAAAGAIFCATPGVSGWPPVHFQGAGKWP